MVDLATWKPTIIVTETNSDGIDREKSTYTSEAKSWSNTPLCAKDSGQDMAPGFAPEGQGRSPGDNGLNRHCNGSSAPDPRSSPAWNSRLDHPSRGQENRGPLEQSLENFGAAS